LATVSLLVALRFPLSYGKDVPGGQVGQCRRHRRGNEPQHIRSLRERLAGRHRVTLKVTDHARAEVPMRMQAGLLLGSRATRVLDIALVLWVAAWIAIGVLAGNELRDLRSLSDTVVGAGTALDQTGRALETIGQVPLVGEGPAELGQRVRESAAEVRTAGRSSSRSIGNLSLLLGLAIAVIPAMPVLGFYLPLRLRRAREAEAVARHLADRGLDPGLEELLARRAIHWLPYHVLQAVSTDPVKDLQAGRFDRLARAELRRLGLDAPAGRDRRRVYA
jgi:hypothetical protein